MFHESLVITIKEVMSVSIKFYRAVTLTKRITKASSTVDWRKEKMGFKLTSKTEI